MPAEARRPGGGTGGRGGVILLVDNYDSFTYNLAHLFVELDGRGIFAGVPQRFEAGRYHSLAATSVPECLEVSATAADGEVMAVRHRELPIDGVQFHPESVLTPVGAQIARNFLER